MSLFLFGVSFKGEDAFVKTIDRCSEHPNRSSHKTVEDLFASILFSQLISAAPWYFASGLSKNQRRRSPISLFLLF